MPEQRNGQIDPSFYIGSQPMTTTTITQPVNRRSRFWGRSPEGALGRSRERLGWALVTPTVITLLVVAIYPLGRTLWLSLTNARLGSTRAIEFIGLDNYNYLLATIPSPRGEKR